MAQDTCNARLGLRYGVVAPVQTGLCVKELAGALEVSKNYVYEMRRCGFRMRGVNRQGQTATREEALQWIKDNDFRLRDGCGLTRKMK
jgi:hypothetical protein